MKSDGTSLIPKASNNHRKCPPERLAYFLSKLSPPASCLPNGYSALVFKRSVGKHEDFYLFGHPSGNRFRSANEFNPHWKWLNDGMVGNCSCLYCSGKKVLKKTQINQSIGKRRNITRSSQQRNIKKISQKRIVKKNTQKRNVKKNSPVKKFRNPRSCQGPISWVYTGDIIPARPIKTTTITSNSA
jgi:hypothetical protein